MNVNISEHIIFSYFLYFSKLNITSKKKTLPVLIDNNLYYIFYNKDYGYDLTNLTIHNENSL